MGKQIINITDKKIQNLFNKKQLVKSKITIEELLNLYDDICVILPRSTMYFAMWYFSFQKKKYAYQLSIIKKHIELQQKYYHVYGKENVISNYIMPLDDAKIIINAIKNNTLLKQINVVNILKSEFEQFESDINRECFILERIKNLKEKKYLTIAEKKELVLYGEQVPICVGDSYSSNKNMCGVVPFYSIYHDKLINLEEIGPSLVKKKK